MSWYSSLMEPDNAEDWIKIAMVKQSSSIDELWQSLNKAGITDKIGTPSRQEFEKRMQQKDPSFVGSLSQHSLNLQEGQQQQIQSAYSNFVSGRILSEEISKARQQAASQGREPSVAELRAARRIANDRLLNEGIFDVGLGIPSQIHVGRRGPLGRIRLKPTDVPSNEKITDTEIQNMANQLLAEEQERARAIARQRFENGETSSPEPTAADMRAAVLNANQRLKEGLKFRVGTRGPLPSKFELNRNIENSKEYYEWKKKQKMKENLGLSDVLDVEPGNIAVPYPDMNDNDNLSPEEQMVEDREKASFQEDLDIIQKQSNYPVKPPVHPPTCRCMIVQEGKTFKWQTAGDDRVCDECKKHAIQFNQLRNNNI